MISVGHRAQCFVPMAAWPGFFDSALVASIGNWASRLVEIRPSGYYPVEEVEDGFVFVEIKYSGNYQLE